MGATSVDYKKTVNLPRTDFPMKANLPQMEPKMLARWEAENLYAKIRSARAGSHSIGSTLPLVPNELTMVSRVTFTKLTSGGRVLREKTHTTTAVATISTIVSQLRARLKFGTSRSNQKESPIPPAVSRAPRPPPPNLARSAPAPRIQ